MESTKGLDGELAWFIGLIEGEGSFHVRAPQRRQPRGTGAFSLQMTDLDVVERVKTILSSWGIDRNITQPRPDERFKKAKQPYMIETRRASYLKIIIGKTYDFYSEKKKSDCDRVLKNLADRGLL